MTEQTTDTPASGNVTNRAQSLERIMWAMEPLKKAGLRSPDIEHLPHPATPDAFITALDALYIPGARREEAPRFALGSNGAVAGPIAAAAVVCEREFIDRMNAGMDVSNVAAGYAQVREIAVQAAEWAKLRARLFEEADRGLRDPETARSNVFEGDAMINQMAAEAATTADGGRWAKQVADDATRQAAARLAASAAASEKEAKEREAVEATSQHAEAMLGRMRIGGTRPTPGAGFGAN